MRNRLRKFKAKIRLLSSRINSDDGDAECGDESAESFSAFSDDGGVEKGFVARLTSKMRQKCGSYKKK
jgi:hypothetical protein